MRILLIIAAAFTMSSGYVFGGVISDDIDFSVSFDGDRMFGHSTKELSIDMWYPEYGAMVTGGSELEYSLDAYMAAIKCTLSGTLFGKVNWLVGARAVRNVTDPSGPLKDSDYLSLVGYGINRKIIYSESDVEWDSDDYAVWARLDLYRQKGLELGAIAGYRYQRFSFVGRGVTGWYLDENWEPVYRSGYAGVPVVAYRVTYDIPYGGIAAEIDLPADFHIDATVTASPYVMARDFDDHILRFKTGEGDCTGAAVMADAKTAWTVTGPFTGVSWVVGLGGTVTYISTTGSQVQVWYGDDPASEYDDTGSSSSGIPYKIRSFQGTLGLTLACRF